MADISYVAAEAVFFTKFSGELNVELQSRVFAWLYDDRREVANAFKSGVKL